MADDRTLELRPEDLPTSERTLELRPEDLPTESQVLGRDVPVKRPSKKDQFYMDPTEGMSTTQKTLAGAGKFFADTGSGIRQVLATPLNALGQAVMDKDILSHDYEGEKERKRLDSPLMNTVAGNVGYAGAGMATLALPGAAVTSGVAPTLGRLASMASGNPTVLAALAKYAPLAASSAAMSTLTPTTESGERLKNAGVAAALSPAFQKTGELVGRAAKPVVDWLGDHANAGPLLRKSWSSTATPQQSQTVARAMMNDVPVYPSQLRSPGSPIGSAKAEGQLNALTKAVNRTMGEETENIGGAFTTARDRLGDTYNALFNNKTIPLNAQSGTTPANAIGQNGGSPPSQFVQRVMDIGKEHNTGSPILQPSKELNDAIEQAIGYAQTNGTLTGRQYQELLRRYAESAKRASRGTELNISDPRAAKGFSDLTDALTEQAEKVMAPHELQLFKTANKQWRNMKTLESLAPTKVDGGADYNPTSLARKLARTDKDAFLYGRGDPTLGDLGKFGSTYMGLEANAPQGFIQRTSRLAKHAAPLLVGDALGAAALGAAIDDDRDHGDTSLAASGVKYGGLALLMHGLLTGGKSAMNPRLTMGQLGLPQGALSELFQRMQAAPAAAALINNQRGDE